MTEGKIPTFEFQPERVRSRRSKMGSNSSDNSGESRKVDFVVAGAMKSGTSALDVYLREHPEICMGTLKEVHFFDNEEYFRNTHVNYDTYHSFFEPSGQHKVLGESTQIYMYWQDCPRRLWEYNPNMKIVMILRNPIERAHSMYYMQVTRGIESLSFWDALHQEAERARMCLPYQDRRFSYVDRGLYVEQLRRIWRYFPQQQTLILKSESLKTEPAVTLNKICSFLGVSNFKVTEKKTVNAGNYPQMSGRERDYLRGVFEYEILNLERILGWDCSDWLKKDCMPAPSGGLIKTLRNIRNLVNLK